MHEHIYIYIYPLSLELSSFSHSNSLDRYRVPGCARCVIVVAFVIYFDDDSIYMSVLLSQFVLYLLPAVSTQIALYVHHCK